VFSWPVEVLPAKHLRDHRKTRNGSHCEFTVVNDFAAAGCVPVRRPGNDICRRGELQAFDLARDVADAAHLSATHRTLNAGSRPHLPHSGRRSGMLIVHTTEGDADNAFAPGSAAIVRQLPAVHLSLDRP
jgi:hypothetical protein